MQVRHPCLTVDQGSSRLLRAWLSRLSLGQVETEAGRDADLALGRDDGRRGRLGGRHRL